MHEYSLVEALMERVVAEAAARKALAVHKVSVRVGELAGVEPELLVTAFEMCREGTICAEASLELVRVRAVWVCGACGAKLEEGQKLVCSCGGVVRLESGDELFLDRIEMEVP